MRIQQLHYIIKIVETGSMNEAAKQLFITQPSLSNAVRFGKWNGDWNLYPQSEGITLTRDGMEFLSYARQVVEQTQLLEERYKILLLTAELFSVSSQHYAFGSMLSSLLKKSDMEKYELFLRETRTWEIIDDVKNFRSEVGVLFLNSYNRDVLTKNAGWQSSLGSPSLYSTTPYLCQQDQPSGKERQGETVWFWKTSLTSAMTKGRTAPSTFRKSFPKAPQKKSIVVSDRATLFNLLIGLDGCSVAIRDFLVVILTETTSVSIPLDVTTQLS